MKIYIRYNEDGKNHTIRLWLPLFILKQKWIYRAVSKNTDNKNITLDNDGLNKLVDISSIAYKDLKKFIKENGHFNLVEVDATDGTKVVIRV